jgi:transposase
MSVSSIASPQVVASVKPPETQPKPQVKVDGDANDISSPQPVVQAALPPGQGTRVNQIA